FISAPGHKHLTTQINLAGDEYTYDDFAFATRDELVVDARPVARSAAGERHGVTGPVTEVEFNIQLVSTSKPEHQQRHERKRALETAE
ncbi:catechol 1,2-dioxygenase, partial [Oceanimonas baumannii]